jgi:hypothetical protein
MSLLGDAISTLERFRGKRVSPNSEQFERLQEAMSNINASIDYTNDHDRQTIPTASSGIAWYDSTAVNPDARGWESNNRWYPAPRRDEPRTWEHNRQEVRRGRNPEGPRVPRIDFPPPRKPPKREEKTRIEEKDEERNIKVLKKG